MKSPRMIHSERECPTFEDAPYVYTYIHHADIGTLFASAAAGCKLCTILRGSMSKCPDFDEIAAEYSLAEGSAEPNSTYTTESDKDSFTASQLAKVARKDRLYEPDDLKTHGHGRIIIQCQFDDKSGLWGCDFQSDAIAYALTTPLIESEGLKFCHSPGMWLSEDYMIG